MEYQLIKHSHPKALSTVEQILFNRGIEVNEIEHYLNTTDDDILNPAIIQNIKTGA